MLKALAEHNVPQKVPQATVWKCIGILLKQGQDMFHMTLKHMIYWLWILILEEKMCLNIDPKWKSFEISYSMKNCNKIVSYSISHISDAYVALSN